MDRSADLLAAIVADPADDGPREAYADWCRETGDPERANFIQWQLEQAKLGCVLGHKGPGNAVRGLCRLTDCRHCVLGTHCHHVLYGHPDYDTQGHIRFAPQALRTMAAGAAPHLTVRWAFERGFVAALTLDVGVVLRPGDVSFKDVLVSAPVTRVTIERSTSGEDQTPLVHGLGVLFPHVVWMQGPVNVYGRGRNMNRYIRDQIREESIIYQIMRPTPAPVTGNASPDPAAPDPEN
jgi:uncharacterized protein (TIGR02996 family)